MATDNCRVPLPSKQTSNQNSDRLDFDPDDCGKAKHSGKSKDGDSDLEDGEILSDTDTNDEDSKCRNKRTGKSDVRTNSSRDLKKLKDINGTEKVKNKLYDNGSSENVEALSKYERRIADSDSRRCARQSEVSRDSTGETYTRRSRSGDRDEQRRWITPARTDYRNPRENPETRPQIMQKVEISDKSGPNNMLNLDLISKARKQGVKTIHVPVSAPKSGRIDPKEDVDISFLSSKSNRIESRDERKFPPEYPNTSRSDGKDDARLTSDYSNSKRGESKEETRPMSDHGKCSVDVAKKLEIDTTLKSLIPESKTLKKPVEDQSKKDSQSKSTENVSLENNAEALQALKMKAQRHRQKTVGAKMIKPDIVILAPADGTKIGKNNELIGKVDKYYTVSSQMGRDTKNTLAVFQKDVTKCSSVAYKAESSGITAQVSKDVDFSKEQIDTVNSQTESETNDAFIPALPSESPPPLPPDEPVAVTTEDVSHTKEECPESSLTDDPTKYSSDMSLDADYKNMSKSSDMPSSENFCELYSGDESDAVSDKFYSGSDKEENDLYSIIFPGSYTTNGASLPENTGNTEDKTESDLDKTIVEDGDMTSTPQKRKRSRSKENSDEESTTPKASCPLIYGVPPQKKQRKTTGETTEGSVVEVEQNKEHLSSDVTIDTSRSCELDIIDAVEGEEEELGDDMDDVSDEEMLDDSELHALLEEGIDKQHQTEDDDEPVFRSKVVLDEKGSDPFELLPEGWVVVTHNCGMPVYLHKVSRVCTMSKPYFLGPGSVRKHDIPLGSIPCLQYRKALVKEKESDTEAQGSRSKGQVNELTIQGDEGENNGFSGMEDRSKLLPLPVKIECAEESQKQASLTSEEVKEYCDALFHFKTITVKKFKSWRNRRKHLLRLRQQKPRPTLPSSTKLIKCTVPQESSHGEEKRQKRKEFVLNPMGKSFVCILHEYAQHTLKVQPKYVFRELENAQSPYSATVVINDIMYGTGYSSSKKSAKMEAAKITLEILIPEMTKVMEDSANEHEDLSFFDTIKIEDPRVYDLCNKAGQNSPYQILLECLKRNFGMGDTSCKVEVKPLKHQKSEYSLSVGKHTVSVVCKNKREGKQRAAQAMLQTLHPHIFSLGALLRLYGKSSWKSVKEKKKEEHTITKLQSHAKANRPNKALLDKLKEEMTILREQRKAIPSKGKFIIDTATLARESIKTIDL